MPSELVLFSFYESMKSLSTHDERTAYNKKIIPYRLVTLHENFSPNEAKEIEIAILHERADSIVLRVRHRTKGPEKTCIVYEKTDEVKMLY
jgi:hypothetical protein